MQPARCRQLDSPACHARLSNGTYWVSFPERLMNTCVDTLVARKLSNVGSSRSGSVLVNNASTNSLSKLPAGTEMP